MTNEPEDYNRFAWGAGDLIVYHRVEEKAGPKRGNERLFWRKGDVTVRRAVTGKAEYEEEDHPRDEQGRWTSAGSAKEHRPVQTLAEFAKTFRDTGATVSYVAFADIVREQMKKLPTPSESAVQDYVADDDDLPDIDLGYSLVNKRLRQRMPFDKMPPNTAAAIRHLDDAFNYIEPVGAPLKVYRGADTDMIFGAQVGDEIQDDGFVSTSFSRNSAANFTNGLLLEIDIPATTKLLLASTSEFEGILPRGSRFMIDAIEQTTVRKWIDGEEPTSGINPPRTLVKLRLLPPDTIALPDRRMTPDEITQLMDDLAAQGDKNYQAAWDALDAYDKKYNAHVRDEVKKHLISKGVYEEEEHPRDESGKWAKKGDESDAPAVDHPAGAVFGKGKRVPAEKRTWKGEVEYGRSAKTEASRLLLGARGEWLAAKVLGQLFGTEFKNLNTSAGNNSPIDLIGDSHAIEVKAGKTTNTPSAQRWRITHGQPGVDERELMRRMTPEELTRYNKEKTDYLVSRKRRLVSELSQKMGKDLKAATVGIIFSPSMDKADVFVVPDFHPTLRWNHFATEKYYVGTYDARRRLE